MGQTPTGSESARGGDESSERSLRAHSSTATTRSRVFSQSDIESSDYPLVTNRARRRSVGHDDAEVGPSMVGSKRSRDLENQDETVPPPKRIRLRRPSARTLRAVNFHFVVFLPAHTLSLQPDSQLSTIAEESVAIVTPLGNLRGGPDTLQSEEVQDRTIEPAELPTASTSNSTQITASRATPARIEPTDQATASSSRVDQTVTLWRKPTPTVSSFGSNPAFAAVGIPPQATIRH